MTVVSARVDDDALGVPPPRRSKTTGDRLLDAAVEMTMDGGWASVTMSRLASKAGVSRQTVYNDVGARPALAEAMILREVERFLSCVTEAFEGVEDLLVGVREATYAVLERSHGNQLMHAIVSATHGADTELLPFLTSKSKGLLEIAVGLVKENMARFDHGLTDCQLDLAVETVVRSVLSHVMHPSKEPAETADDITWLVARVIGMESSLP